MFVARAVQTGPAGPVSVVNRSTGSNSSTVSSQVVTLPTGGSTGNLYLIFFNPGTYGTVSTSSSGWTTFGQYNTADPSIGVFAGVLGTASSTLTVALGASGQCAWAGLLIAGWSGNIANIAVASATGSSTTPTSPTLTPSWGSAQNLWVLATSAGGGNGVPSAAPSGYSNFQSVASFTSGTAAEATAATCELISTASSVTPGAFGASSFSQTWDALTVAVKPGR